MLGSSVLSLLAFNTSHLIGDEDEDDDDNEMNQQVTNASNSRSPFCLGTHSRKTCVFPRKYLQMFPTLYSLDYLSFSRVHQNVELLMGLDLGSEMLTFI